MELLTKDMIEEAVKDALLDIEAEVNALDNSDAIMPDDSADVEPEDIAPDASNTEDTDKVDNEVEDAAGDEVVETETETQDSEVVDDSKVTDDVEDITVTDVTDEVSKAIDEDIENSGEYNIFGVDIKVEKTDDDKYSVTLTSEKNEKTNTVTLDNVDTQTLFDAVEDFMNTMVLECQDDECENKLPADCAECVEPDTCEDGDAICDENCEGESEDEESDSKDDAMMLDEYMGTYKDDVESMIACGLAAKRLAISMVKDKIMANSLAELSSKIKSNNKIIAAKKKELEAAKYKYLLAKKIDIQFGKAYSVLSSGINDITEAVVAGKLSNKVTASAMDKYKFLVSKLVKANNSSDIANTIESIKEINTIIASAVMKDKKCILSSSKVQNIRNPFKNKNNIRKVLMASRRKQSSTMRNDGRKRYSTHMNRNMEDVREQRRNSSIYAGRKPSLRMKNVLNYDTLHGGKPLMSSKNDEYISEMVAEIVEMCKM